MLNKYGPINPKVPHFLHGGDYNPDQWIDTPEIWDEDMRLMKLSNCNAMSVGIFSWTSLEPEEGKFDFSWLDTIMDKLHKSGGYAVLATPSGARPAWMSQKYPEVLRVSETRVRNLHGQRHNHCYTSPIYREKVNIINTKLAERYKDHPALLVWHLSNEYGGECHCELCQEAFRDWLKVKYDNDLDKLNHAYWTRFWSHTYTDWSQIESPSSIGENFVHGLNLDWKRFVTHQTIDFIKHESEPLKRITPNVPITTNLMGTYPGLDYFKVAKVLDVVSWDSYPAWHGVRNDIDLACTTSFLQDLNRSLKGGMPFMLMESTPSHVNWHEINKLKRPGMHLLSSIQAVAHGSDTIQYFQWRKSRGSAEKFHGAVVDHVGHENTRVFREVTKVGEHLKKFDEIVGTTVKPEVAIIYDWENKWAIDDFQGLHRYKKEYQETCEENYKTFWSNGIPVDVIDMDCDFSEYKLLIAPMLYMVKPTVDERIKKFVKDGGTLVTTFLTGYVDENDLCFLGGFPGPLKDVLGIWAEDIDALYDNDKNAVEFLGNNDLDLNGVFDVRKCCEIIHLEGAKALATYKDDFYKDMPAVTVNEYGKGKAYHIAARVEEQFYKNFYIKLASNLNLKKVLETELPYGVTAQMRTDGDNSFIFIMNFNNEVKEVKLDKEYRDVISNSLVNYTISLEPYGFVVLKNK